ncbi:MAG: right-handed parallel beta-helix repeat-containing protein, partial [Candidatus Cloacimonetes bacterium]|nr:right-handed parallel beta-helix repeat-containing protein [Candidatus Cloacimonadota bacterium]
MKQNNKKTFRVIFLLVIGMSLIAWMPVPAMATTWHVYDGESINDYTGYNGAYWGVVSTGDTIFVHNGTYYGTFDIDKPNLTVIGEGSDFVTYDGEGTGQVIMPNGTTAGLDATGTILEGFEFINSPYGAFIGSYGPATDCKIRNNVFEGLTASGGLTTYDLNITIENNVFSNCIGSWCALYVGFGVVGLSDFSTIANNTFTNNTGSRALTLRQASYCNVVNNTIINNAGDGIRLYKTTANNNTITRNNISSNGGIICLKDAGEGNKLYLNNFVNNPGGVTYSGTSPAITYWNSISQIVYVYNGTTYTGQMGNYWGSDYTGTDADGDGIGDTPYPIPGSATDCDSFPLIAEFDYNNYLIPDFNLSGYVDASDLQLFGDHWHFTAEDSLNWDPIYNLEHTPVGGYQYIDAGDLQVFGDNWHQGTPPRYGSGGKSGKGPNEFAGIVFDLDATTYGNQNLTDIPSQPAGTYIRLDVYCTGVQNLDTYEFEVIYDPTELAYVTATPTNPITMEGNILESNGGTALGWMIDTSTPGVLSIAYTLTGTDPAQAPEGEG